MEHPTDSRGRFRVAIRASALLVRPVLCGNGMSTAPWPRRWFPDWYLAVASLLLALFVIVSVAYFLGAGGISVYGADAIKFSPTMGAMFKIDDQRA